MPSITPHSLQRFLRRHRPAIIILALAGLLLPVPPVLTSSAMAQTEGDSKPGFDCTRASNATERTICKDESLELAARDAALTRLYGFLYSQGATKQFRQSQMDWIKARNRCGADRDCLARSYGQRLAALANDAGDYQHITGTYNYKTAGATDTDFGNMWVVRESDGSLTGGLLTISGPTFHSCTLGFKMARPTATGWVWTSPEVKRETGEACEIEFTRQGRGLRVQSTPGCRNYYCGARGFFDNSYARARQ